MEHCPECYSPTSLYGILHSTLDRFFLFLQRVRFPASKLPLLAPSFAPVTRSNEKNQESATDTPGTRGPKPLHHDQRYVSQSRQWCPLRWCVHSTQGGNTMRLPRTRQWPKTAYNIAKTCLPREGVVGKMRPSTLTVQQSQLPSPDHVILSWTHLVW